MKNFNIKALRIGSYSIGLTAIVIAVIVVLNLFVGQIPSKFTKPDMTGDALLTFGDETKKLVATVDEEVNIYHIVSEGNEDAYITELLSRYEAESDKINVKKIDPIKQPTFIDTYTKYEISENTVVVESEKRNTLVDGSEFYMYELAGAEGNYMTESMYQYYLNLYMNYYGQQLSATPYFFGEKEISGAIDYVISDTLPVVYSVTGHGETPFGDYYKDFTETENVEMKELTILSGETASIPADAKAVFINAPQNDITEDEYKALVKYLDDGGEVILTTIAGHFSKETQPNLLKFTEYMGLTATSDIICESDANCYYQYPYYVIPKVQEAGIMANSELESYSIYSVLSHPIKETGAENRTVSPLLKTSAKAYIYNEADAGTKLEDIAKDTFTVAYEAVIANSETGETAGRLTWFSSYAFFSDEVASMGAANSLVYSTMLQEMCGKTTSINVTAKEITSATLSLTAADAMVGSTAYVIIVPLAFLVCGFVMWILRRRK